MVRIGEERERERERKKRSFEEVALHVRGGKQSEGRNVLVL